MSSSNSGQTLISSRFLASPAGFPRFMRPMKLSALVFLALPLVPATQAADLKPLMAVPGQAVLQDDFAKPGQPNKEQWSPRQGTRWIVEDGVLRGRPSTSEYQAKRSHHKGLEPRLSSPATPAQFIARFSVRFSGGAETAIVPFIEFGHHVCRLHLTQDGAEVLADGESVKVAESRELKYEPGRWYHILAELKGEEVVIQFESGPVLHASHPCFAKPTPGGGNGLGLAGPSAGIVELDNVTLWSIKPDPQPGWAAKRDTLPLFTHIQAATKKKTN